MLMTAYGAVIGDMATPVGPAPEHHRDGHGSTRRARRPASRASSGTGGGVGHRRVHLDRIPFDLGRVGRTGVREIPGGRDHRRPPARPRPVEGRRAERGHRVRGDGVALDRPRPAATLPPTRPSLGGAAERARGGGGPDGAIPALRPADQPHRALDPSPGRRAAQIHRWHHPPVRRGGFPSRGCVRRAGARAGRRRGDHRSRAPQRCGAPVTFACSPTPCRTPRPPIPLPAGVDPITSASATARGAIRR